MSGPLRLAAAATAYLVLAVLWTWPLAVDPGGTAPDVGDPLHLAWVMAWDAHALRHQPLALFDSNSFFPYPGSLAFGDHLVPEALLVAPANWATGNPVLASNLAVGLGLWLSALAAHTLLRRCTGSDGAGFVAGVVLAFNAFTHAEQLRVHVLHLEAWPLAALALLAFAGSGRWRDAALAAGMLALQGLLGGYYLAYTALVAPLWIGLAFAAHRRWPTPRDVGRLVACGALAALPVAGLVAPAVLALRALGGEKPLATGADLAAFVRPGVESEVPHYLGPVALVLAAVGVVSGWRSARVGRRFVAWAGLAALASGVALAAGPSLRFDGNALAPGPYALLHALVPPARAMASPERFTALARFGLALTAGLGAAALLSRVGPRLRGPGALVVGLLLMLEQWPGPHRLVAVPRPDDGAEVQAWLARQSRDPLIDLPVFGEERLRYRALDLLLSTRHWRPIPIGRTSFYPPAHDVLAWGLREFPDHVSLTLLDRLGVHTLVVHPRRWSAAERPGRLAALAAEPRLRLLEAFTGTVDGRLEALGLGGEQVFSLVAAPAPPPPCEPADEIARDGWTFASTSALPQAVADDDPATSWRTLRQQLPADRLRVRLARPERVAAVVLERSVAAEFGRDLVVGLETPDGAWVRPDLARAPAESWAEVAELLARPRHPRQILRIVPPVEARAVRVVVGGDAAQPALANGWPPWSVSELRLYRSCR